jgi:hypothetical protein
VVRRLSTALNSSTERSSAIRAKAAKSDNLPLFSRISLMRVMKALRVMSVDAAFGFVPDASPKKVGRRKTKKAA